MKTMSSYKIELSQTCPRLTDRLLTRPSSTNELETLQKVKKLMTTQVRQLFYPMQYLGFQHWYQFFFYTEFAAEIPVAGGSFSYLRVELDDFIAFIAAGNILLDALVGSAGLGRSWSSYFASMIRSDSDFLRIKVLPEWFNLLDPLAVVVLLVANGVAMSGTKRTFWLNWISSLVSGAVIVFVIIFGFIHGKTSNLEPFFPYTVEVVFRAAAVVYWSYTGFELVANMVEETKKPSRDIPIVLVGSMSGITVVYCLMALALTMMVNYSKIDVNAAYSVAFEQIGMKWAKYLVTIFVLKGMTISLLVGSLGQARLDVLSSVLSLSMLFIFMLISVALLVRRYYVKDVTPKNDLIKFLMCLFIIIGSSIRVSALWNSNERGWIGYTVAGLLWFLGTLRMAFLSKQRVPKKEIEKLKRCSAQDSCDSRSFLCVEKLPWSNNFSNTLKQLSIARCPKILCIHLQRASINVFGEQIKLQVSLTGKLPPSETKLYRLVSVVEHFGRSGGGHYTVYRSMGAKSDEEDSDENSEPAIIKWFCISDSQVYTVSEKDVLAAEASLLFYERIVES
ncbi:hypothetical protein CRYUN_Cryun38cG0027900 [Craigia yunnanensis]